MTEQQTFAAALDRLARIMGGTHAADAKRLSGGASQETWSFDCVSPGGTTPCILRRSPNGMAVELTSQAIGLLGEAQVIKAARKRGAPAPDVLHVCTPEDGLGPAYVMRRLEGETLGRKILRDEPFAKARTKLAAQCGEALALIHATPQDEIVSLPFADARSQLDRYEETYLSFGISRPVFDLGFATLRKMAPPPVDPVLIHGDFRLGNIMVSPNGFEAALDWELAHLGDPAEDFGWICTPSWRFSQVDNEVGGFGKLADLLRGYHDAGGARYVDHARVRFWTMMGSLKWGVMCLTMFRAFDSGMDRSVERATIGRRASENELDLMLMLTGRL